MIARASAPSRSSRRTGCSQSGRSAPVAIGKDAPVDLDAAGQLRDPVRIGRRVLLQFLKLGNLGRQRVDHAPAAIAYSA